MTQYTKDEKNLLRVRRCFGRGVKAYHLIEDGDKILIGLSGGKDSLALVELLGRRAKQFKPQFSVVAVHVVIENIPYQSDTDYLRDYCEQYDVPFIRYVTRFEMGADFRKSPCFLCSWNRRKALFTVAKEQGCNKVALAHHMDDILETLLMNMCLQGSFSSMPPKMVMDKFDMTLIRPFCLVHESDLELMATIRGFKKQDKNCPYETQSDRHKMKDILQQMLEINPHIRYNLWNSMTNIQKEYLPEIFLKR
ncbi:MAG: ATP-binding protein [Bacteroidaceae bacterium]